MGSLGDFHGISLMQKMSPHLDPPRNHGLVGDETLYLGP